jgi:hypothetical protein
MAQMTDSLAKAILDGAGVTRHELEQLAYHWLKTRADQGGEAVAGEPSNDREALVYLMKAFDTESWQCPNCGRGEDCATMDSAYFLRDYLASHPPRATAVEDARDAARYRWLKRQKSKEELLAFVLCKDGTDAAIDAALPAQRGE